MGKYWEKSTTHRYRYDALGIIDYMFKYAESSAKNRLTVIDIGCSKAVATRFAKTCLNGRGIKSFTIGIDNSIRIAEDAEENLDEFILNDVMNVERYCEEADVAICSKAIRNVDGVIRSKVLGKCAGFLKDDGVLITDAEGYKKSVQARGLGSLELSEPRKIYRYSFPESAVVGCFELFRKETKMMGKNDALEYSRQIKDEWDSLSVFEKRSSRPKQILSDFVKRMRSPVPSS